MLVTILTTAEVLYIAGLATWILLEKRPPVATLAWILALVGLPYVGFVVFFFLGPRHLKRKRLKHKRARSRARANAPQRTLEAAVADLRDDPRVEQLGRLAVTAGEPPIDVCERVRIFHDAASTYDAIVAAIAKAEHHVHVAYYIFDSGAAGTRLCEALCERARTGVRVRVLLDAVGSSAMKRAMVKKMHAAGIIFARFNPVRLARIRSRIDFRNHRKIVVCDGRLGFTGGINVSDDYVGDAPWRDSHVEIEGDVVRWLQLTFLDDWNYATSYVPKDRAYFPPPSGKGAHRVQIVASGPDRETEPIQRLYFAAIAGARARVLVTTPYFIPDDAVLTALTTAALRGVDVRVLVPRRSDSLIVTAAARSYYDDLLEAGGRVYEYQPTMIHAKTVVVDDYFAAVGTANLDNRSFRLNFEVTAVLYGAEHAAELGAQFERDLSRSKAIDARDRARISIPWRVGEAGARLLSPIL